MSLNKNILPGLLVNQPWKTRKQNAILSTKFIFTHLLEISNNTAVLIVTVQIWHENEMAFENAVFTWQEEHARYF